MIQGFKRPIDHASKKHLLHMLTSFIHLAGLMSLSAVIYLLLRHRQQKAHLPLPPGPKRLPIIGNLLDAPKAQDWITFAKWGRQYGSGIVHFDLVGTSVVVINSIKIAHELLENRSLIYSDRPAMTMLNELIGFTWNFAFMPYGRLWKAHRKIFHQEFHPVELLQYRPQMLAAARMFLRALDRTPENFMAHLRHMAGTVILSIAYGIEVQPDNDPYVDIGEKSLHAMACAGNSGAYLVDTFPILKHLPAWFPGAGFQIQAREWRKSVLNMAELPFEFVKRSIVAGTAPSSIALKRLKEIGDLKDSADQERILCGAMGAMYAGGTDTTVSALGSFILAMTQNPDVQKRAQKAIEEVVGKDRLPDFSDISSIPYVDAILKEVHRWKPVVPLAVPHRVMVDDVFNGYRIPAGSVVVGNAWAMLYDEDTYPEPLAFKPERFLKDGKLNMDVLDPDVAFGFGRRVCPGKSLANASMWIMIASILASFDITKAVDGEGVTIEPLEEYSSGMLCYPAPFKCVIRPRSAEAELLILATALDNDIL